MALRFGNDHLVWVSTTSGGTYALVKGQEALSLGGSTATVDGSHKTSGGIELVLPGLASRTISLTVKPDLPDATGLTVIETAFKAKTTVFVAIRKGGTTATATDNIWLCEMYVTEFAPSFGKNEVVSVSIGFGPAAAPTTDLTLA